MMIMFPGERHRRSPSARCCCESFFDSSTQSHKPNSVRCIQDHWGHQEHPALHLHHGHGLCLGHARHRWQPHLLREQPPQLALSVGRLAGPGGRPLEPAPGGRQSVPAGSAHSLAASRRRGQDVPLR